MDIDRGKLMQELRDRMKSVDPLPGDEDFFNNAQTLSRFLKARDFDVDEAEKQLKATVDWRRQTDPIHVDCLWCHQKPGFHGMRQVGFDESGRPVIYACFSQASTEKLTVEDIVCHSTYLIENAKRTMSGAISSWIFVMDCTGMSLPSCNPRLGYGISQIFSNYYPERLGLMICFHHNPVFQGVWNAIKFFLQPNTVAKMQMIRSKKKLKELFANLFSDELSDWMLEEIRLNKEKPLSTSQRAFWERPDVQSTHDPRGCPSYVANYVEPFLSNVDLEPEMTHRPHPNIIDSLRGVITKTEIMVSTTGGRTRKQLDGIPTAEVNGGAAAAILDASTEETSSEGEDNGQTVYDIAEMDEEYKIPKNAKLLGI